MMAALCVVWFALSIPAALFIWGVLRGAARTNAGR
jgi:hypothetical protein